MTSRIVVLVSGSGTLLQAVMDSSVRNSVVAVGSDLADCQGLARAQKAGIATFVVEPATFANRSDWNSALLAQLIGLNPDVILLAGFMRILGPGVISQFQGQIINTHPALLPFFPGAHGVRDALAAGVLNTGCTLHYVDEGVDTGEIISQRIVPVLDGDDEASLHERIKIQERDLLVSALELFVATGSFK
ncbi:MAG: phosphoribosylglycinamide formyltransferase [Actinomycetes bacterium]